MTRLCGIIIMTILFGVACGGSGTTTSDVATDALSAGDLPDQDAGPVTTDLFSDASDTAEVLADVTSDTLPAPDSGAEVDAAPKDPCVEGDKGVLTPDDPKILTLTPPGDSVANLALCHLNDWDYFKITLAQPGWVHFKISYDLSDGNSARRFVIELPAESIVPSYKQVKEADANRALFSYFLKAGTHAVRIYAAAGHGRYALSFLPICTENSECTAPDTHCSTVFRTCKPDECNDTTTPCTGGNVCHNKECVQCSTGADCSAKTGVLICQPELLKCVACLTSQDCADDADTGSTKCDTTRFSCVCDDNADCKAGNVCFPGTAFNTCKKKECDSSTECEPNPLKKTCEKGRCVECSQSSDCINDAAKTGKLCTNVGACGCESDGDCKVGYCRFGVCQAVECTKNDDCDPGKVCKVDVGHCVECASDTDCQNNPKGSHCDPSKYICGCKTAEHCATSSDGKVCPNFGPGTDNVRFCSPCNVNGDCRKLNRWRFICLKNNSNIHQCSECVHNQNCADNSKALGPLCVNTRCTCKNDGDCNNQTPGDPSDDNPNGPACVKSVGFGICSCTQQGKADECGNGMTCQQEPDAYIWGADAKPLLCI